MLTILKAETGFTLINCFKSLIFFSTKVCYGKNDFVAIFELCYEVLLIFEFHKHIFKFHTLIFDSDPKNFIYI